MTETADFLVVGSGVIGLNIAKRLKQVYPDARVTVLEKEAGPGQHASGRNSGVLHAGFYYTPDSLKAKMTREGNLALTAYCEERGLRINKCGKLVVTRNEAELATLRMLYERGRANGVTLDYISAQEAREIEPNISTCKNALFSPTTSVVDPGEVMAELEKDAVAEGIRIKYREAFTGRPGRNALSSSRNQYRVGYVVNAAGLYADTVARQYGMCKDYVILPFKGIYLYCDGAAMRLATNIYPVPDIHQPFLGVHFTLSVDGHVKIGPTAIPALWREQYDMFGNFNAAEFLDTLWTQLCLTVRSNFAFKVLAWEEIKKYHKPYLRRRSAGLVREFPADAFNTWGRPGIRAQLLDIRNRKLEMDFVLQAGNESMHVLNAVSPAFTCAIPFARYVVERIQQNLH